MNRSFNFFNPPFLSDKTTPELILIAEAVIIPVLLLYRVFFPSAPKDTLPGHTSLNSLVQDMAKQMGIPVPIKVFISQNSLEINDSAQGIYIPQIWNSLQVTLSSEIQQDVFSLRHELAHLKTQDPLVAYASVAIFFDIVAMVMVTKIPLVYSLSLIFFSYASLMYLLRYQEKQADLLAAKFSSTKEIQEVIDKLDTIRSKYLFARNATEKNPLITVLKKLTIDTQGNIFFTFSPLIFDTHPSFSERINYLARTINKEPISRPDLKIYILHEPATANVFDEIFLTADDLKSIQEEIDRSEKRDLYRRLEKIELLPHSAYANVRLFFRGEKPYFIPFDFEPSHISKNLSDVIEIIKTILNRPVKSYYHQTIKDHLAAPSSEELQREFSGIRQRCVFVTNDKYTKKSVYVIYAQEEALLLEQPRVGNWV